MQNECNRFSKLRLSAILLAGAAAALLGGSAGTVLAAADASGRVASKAERFSASGLGCPAVGAIRWDAWHGADSEIGKRVEKVLSPSQWHYRVPFCGRIVGSERVEIECDSQGVMDREIEYAAKARLSYWAFIVNPPDNAMSLALKYYLSSSKKSLVRFALIAQPTKFGDPNTYQPEVARIVELMKEPSYQKVQQDRSLFFVLNMRLANENWSAGGFRSVLESLRSEARQAGLGNPYVVLMEFNPEQGKQWVDEYVFDAMSTYSTRSGEAGAPYGNLVRFVKRYWDRSKATGAQVVPIVMAGWDNRPRAANPSPGQIAQGAERLGKSYYQPGRPEEIAGHVRDAMQWVAANPSATSANTVILYAWNEHDEGGWLVPTLSEGTARVDAIGSTMQRACPER